MAAVVDEESRIKASIDLGTGTIKLMVAKVGSTGQIIESLFELETPVITEETCSSSSAYLECESLVMM